MRNKITIALIFSLSLFYSCTSEIQIVDNQKSNYKIVLSTDASPYEQRAADELQKYLKEISNTELEIVNDSEPTAEYEILIGSNKRLDELNININFNLLEENGFTIRTVGKKLIIAGGTHKGALYAVNTFLEDYLGCRMYTPDVTVIPKSSDVTIPSIDITQIPKIKYRELHIPGARASQEYCDWHKLNHYSERTRDYGLFVHTFNRLIPPEVFFENHPEYFSEVNGSRVPEMQLCLTNPDVYKLVMEDLTRRMKERPDAKVWSVSQNDTFGPCTCNNCAKVDSIHGGHAGSLITFVNNIAAEFPDKTISTLAYQYTREAPVGIKPLPNVMIVLCTIECDRNKPIAMNESDLFNRDIAEWSKLTTNIKIWDYVVQFRNYCDPFPNFRVLKPNLKMFADFGVTKMFEQGSGDSKSDKHELKAYLLAKLLWNPNADAEIIMDDFLHGYYGDAAKFIKLYMNKMHDALEASGKSLVIYGYPYDGIDSYLTPKLINEYSKLFDEAESAVADSPIILDRIKIARLPLEFAILDISKRNVTEDLSIFIESEDGFSVNPQMEQRLNQFVELANKAGYKRLHERGRTPDEFKEEMLDYFKNGKIVHKAFEKPIELKTSFSNKFPTKGSPVLTDGSKGEADFHFNWLGFEATEMEAIIDLQSQIEISTIRTDFLQEIKSWIWLPNKVEYFISEDGKEFQKVGEVLKKADEKEPEAFIESFISNFDKVKTRFVKVKTSSMLRCPKWHFGHNYQEGKAWIFADEIVVN